MNEPLLKLLKREDVVMSRIYAQLSRDLASVLRKYKVTDSGLWKNNPQVRKEFNNALKVHQSRVLNRISETTLDSWNVANKNNDKLVEAYTAGLAVDEATKALMMQRNLDAHKAFLNRSAGGLGLSDRVWNLTKSTKAQMNLFIAEGLTKGRSAAQLATDIKKYLRQPNKRFRRIRDLKTGKLKLSQPAKDYKPGRGVYRSSYANALRLSRNEIGIAYRTADHVRRQQLPFVRGITVNLSNSHPVYDICDELVGDYPKNFVFTGWHPNCLCYTTTKLMSKQEFKKYLKTGQIDNRKYRRAIPTRATKHLNKNADKLNSLKSKPYFLKDNFTNTENGFVLKNKKVSETA